jgi:hypothetical protein
MYYYVWCDRCQQLETFPIAALPADEQAIQLMATMWPDSIYFCSDVSSLSVQNALKGLGFVR